MVEHSGQKHTPGGCELRREPLFEDRGSGFEAGRKGADVEATGEVDEQYDRQRGGTGDDRAEGGQAADATAAGDHDQSEDEDDRPDRHQHI